MNPQKLAIVLSVVSLLMLIGSLVVTPWLLVRLPADYFLLDKPTLWTRLKTETRLRRCLIVLKNLLGILCITAGLLMIMLPGQGLLTLMVGIFLLDFPGKKELERRLVARPSILKAINWLRRRHGRPELILEEAEAQAA